jgi:hypothetical protein
MRVPVLTYHAMNVGGRDYGDNDHVALAQDLRLLKRLGRRIVPLAEVVDAFLAQRLDRLAGAVAITFDDGSWFDWHDIEHPSHGPQRGLAGILRDHRQASGAAVHATSFVIVSPRARETLDRTCMVGRGWWTDDWWDAALAEGLLDLQSHSWDHNHATLDARTDGRARGNFTAIDDRASADDALRQAGAWLRARWPGRRFDLLAWPYGESSAWVRGHYLPDPDAGHGLRAAFGTAPEPVHAGSDRWNLPRYVCGHHWRSPEELARRLCG